PAHSTYSPPLLPLLSFPTRRSSDLVAVLFRIRVRARMGRYRVCALRSAFSECSVVWPGSDEPWHASDLRRACGGRTCAHAVVRTDRKSTRLNSSHVSMSYVDFCLKK